MDGTSDPLVAPGEAPMPSENELRTVMDESDRDVAAGLTVILEDVLLELDAVADRIEARTRTRGG